MRQRILGRRGGGRKEHSGPRVLATFVLTGTRATGDLCAHRGKGNRRPLCSPGQGQQQWPQAGVEPSQSSGHIRGFLGIPKSLELGIPHWVPAHPVNADLVGVCARSWGFGFPWTSQGQGSSRVFQGPGCLLHRGHSYVPGTVQVWRK